VRVFAAIGLPAAVRDHLAGALEMVAPIRTTTRHTWSPGGNWHITLAFYGDRSQGVVEQLSDNLYSAAHQTAPFELSLAGAGVFRQEVGWIGVSDPTGGLAPLAGLLRSQYATADQHAHSRFHVTVPRRAGRAPGLDPVMAALSVYAGPAWTVDKITLFRSDLGVGVEGHPLYSPLFEAKLGDGLV
jgi:2'-5' RNA ligase